MFHNQAREAVAWLKAGKLTLKRPFRRVVAQLDQRNLYGRAAAADRYIGLKINFKLRICTLLCQKCTHENTPS